MDIISEILETDRLADEKIKNAHRRQEELEKQTDEEIAGLDSRAKERAAAYREKMQQRSKNEAHTQIEKIDKEEKEKIGKIDELYKAKHKKWEKAITERILSAD